MFTKEDQRSWITIEIARGRSAQTCFQGLREACGDAALPYRTVARWVKLFREGRDSIQDSRRSGRPHVDNHTIEQPPYSPDMSPCDYDLFAKMKEPLRGIRYNTREAIIRAVGRSLLDINRSGRADGVRRLPQIWRKVVHMGGDYIEGM